MRKGIRIWNGFFETLADAERIYHEYVALDWSGDVYRREYISIHVPARGTTREMTGTIDDHHEGDGAA